MQDGSREDFVSVGFTHHCLILTGTKTLDERLFYIRKCATEHLSVEALKRSIKADDFHHQGKAPNNYLATLPRSQQALRAISTFKDEYLLDFINVEELGVRDAKDVDEHVLEQGIVQNIKQFIMTFGRGFSFVGNSTTSTPLAWANMLTYCFSTVVSTVWWPLSSSEGRSRLPT